MIAIRFFGTDTPRVRVEKLNQLVGVLSTVEEGATGEGSPYVHTQGSPAATWTVNHNKGAYPVIDILSPGGVVVEAEIAHITVNQAVISFASAQTGSAVAR